MEKRVAEREERPLLPSGTGMCVRPASVCSLFLCGEHGGDAACVDHVVTERQSAGRVWNGFTAKRLSRVRAGTDREAMLRRRMDVHVP